MNRKHGPDWIKPKNRHLEAAWNVVNGRAPDAPGESINREK